MKYRQLTKEQFESLNEEFAKFLASQQIDKKEWEQLKKNKPEVAEEELDIFSEIVWEDVLNKTSYIEHFSQNTINLFKCLKNEIIRIVVQVNKKINLNTKDDYLWLLSNISNQNVELLVGKKNYESERNLEIFKLIEKGGNIGNGELFNFISKQITSNQNT